MVVGVVVGVVVVVVVVMVIGAAAAAAQRLMGTAAAAAVMGKCSIVAMSMIGDRNVAMTVPAPGGPLPSRWRAALPPCHLGSKDQT